MLPSRDPLTSGTSSTQGFYCPKALWRALEKNAKLDGYKSTSPYLVDLLAAAIHLREAERAAEKEALDSNKT